MYVRTNYLGSVFRPESFNLTVEKTIAKAEAFRKESYFDTVAFSGVSGSAMGFILGHWLNVPLLCIRKIKDGSHFQGYQEQKVLEGNIEIKSYLIVDDFMSSGKTVDYIIESIEQEVPGARCAGILLYAAARDREHKHRKWDIPVKVISGKPEGLDGY